MLVADSANNSRRQPFQLSNGRTPSGHQAEQPIFVQIESSETELIGRTNKRKTKVRLKTIHANEILSGFLRGERKPHGFDVAPFDVQPHALARSCAASLERAPRRACRSSCPRRVVRSRFACCLLSDASSVVTDVASSLFAELCMSSRSNHNLVPRLLSCMADD